MQYCSVLCMCSVKLRILALLKTCTMSTLRIPAVNRCLLCCNKGSFPVLDELDRFHTTYSTFSRTLFDGIACLPVSVVQSLR